MQLTDSTDGRPPGNPDARRFDLMVKLTTLAGEVSDIAIRRQIESVVDEIDDFIKSLLYDEEVG